MGKRGVKALWTLRRLDEPEKHWLGCKGVSMPQGARDGNIDYVEDLTAYQVRMQSRLTTAEIDDLQPSLDLLLLLPDLDDRKLVFWVGWNFEGEVCNRIYWEKVTRSMAWNSPASKYPCYSHKTLKRYYRRSIDLIAQVLAHREQQAVS